MFRAIGQPELFFYEIKFITFKVKKMTHTTTLIIDGSIYDVLKCDYEFVQPIKENGQPSARPSGGLINFTIVSCDDDDMRFHEWMFNKTETKDGIFNFEIVENGKSSAKKVSFKNAYCIRLHESFDKGNSNQMMMTATISAAEISFGKGKLAFKNDVK